MAQKPPKHKERSFIPQFVADTGEDANKFIPRDAANNRDQPDYDQQILYYDFSDYNQKECEIQYINNQKEARQLTDTLRLGSGVTVKKFKDDIIKRPVHNGGNYSVLFSGLPEGVEMYEITTAHTGRIFGHLLYNTFYVVAIRKNHYDTSKKNRK